MKIRVVLVEPEHDINVGFCSRAMKNFGFRELYIVKPKAPLGFEALKYAKHAQDVFKQAKRVKSMKQALRGCKLVVGTTGVGKRSKQVIRNPISIAELKRRLKGEKGKLALVLGREGMGLSPDEIGGCDLLAKIESDGNYPVLNLSHALAILLYELRGTRGGTWENLAERRERRELVKAFERIAKRSSARNPSKITAAFKNMVERSLISSFEARSMLAALKEV